MRRIKVTTAQEVEDSLLSIDTFPVLAASDSFVNYGFEKKQYTSDFFRGISLRGIGNVYYSKKLSMFIEVFFLKEFNGYVVIEKLFVDEDLKPHRIDKPASLKFLTFSFFSSLFFYEHGLLVSSCAGFYSVQYTENRFIQVYPFSNHSISYFQVNLLDNSKTYQYFINNHFVYIEFIETIVERIKQFNHYQKLNLYEFLTDSEKLFIDISLI